MSKNSRQIDYRIRLAKSVERRMLCAAFQKLSIFHPLRDYRYIGFGAYYFSDFYLFHKELGINDMLSIEKSSGPNIEARYKFNRPFNCIEIDFRESHRVLPELSWEKPTIVWLDYIDVLNIDILSDLQTVFNNLPSGSIYVMSMSGRSESYDSVENDLPEEYSRLDVMKELIGNSLISNDTKSADISNSTIHKVYHQILFDSIKNILYSRNLGNRSQSLSFKQLFNFRYKDGAPMYSFGGLLIDENQHLETFEKADFESLNFIRKEDEAFRIEIPNLTIKEIKYLENRMPYDCIEPDEDQQATLGLFNHTPCIPKKDIDLFAKIYNYFPTFIESRIG